MAHPPAGLHPSHSTPMSGLSAPSAPIAKPVTDLLAHLSPLLPSEVLSFSLAVHSPPCSLPSSRRRLLCKLASEDILFFFLVF